jgi:4-amino-4-deoxy-L-arabinose transferase-like glycosyltransferase
MAIIMPLAIVAMYEAWGRRLRRDRLAALLGAVAICLLPVGAWLVARYQFDGWKFIEHLFWYDFVQRSVSTIEEHPGSWFYYLNVLQKHHYDWLLAALSALLLFPVPRERLRALRDACRSGSGPWPLLASWAVISFVIPTLMGTKLAWYLHPFYPVFAIAVGAILARAVEAARTPSSIRWRKIALAAVIVLAGGVAEGRMIWYSYHHRDLASSSQGLMLAERGSLKGRQVFGARWDRAEIFVAEALVGAKHRLAPDLAGFLRDSQPGDYLLWRGDLSHASISLVRISPRNHLYRRAE